MPLPQQDVRYALPVTGRARRGVSEPRRLEYAAPLPESCRILARNLRLLRTLRGWSQERVALEAGLDRSFVGAVERAERNISFASAEKLAGVFDLTLTGLLTWEI